MALQAAPPVRPFNLVTQPFQLEKMESPFFRGPLLFLLSLVLLTSTSSASETYLPGQLVPGDFETIGLDFLEFHCYDCHDDVNPKADLNLMDLGPVDETNAATWKSVWAQVALQEMPPKKKDQPETIERLQFTDWIVQQLESTMADKGGFHAHQEPGKGNFLDHDLLFGPLPEGIQLEPTSSPKRIWRLTPSEHLTRLNELINTEPEYDPAHPGLRTHGDAVSVNHGGELKLYFGVDRITDWVGGTVAYATAVKSIPVVLSPARKHGFDNYATFGSVNSAETTQILAMAQDILKYMAYGPLSLVSDPPKSPTILPAMNSSNHPATFAASPPPSPTTPKSSAPSLPFTNSSKIPKPSSPTRASATPSAISSRCSPSALLPPKRPRATSPSSKTPSPSSAKKKASSWDSPPSSSTATPSSDPN